MSYFIDTSKLPRKQLAPEVMMRTFWGEKLMINMIENLPYSSVATHSHPHEQAGIVLQGEFEMTIGDEKKLMKPGDAYMVPSGVPHCARGLNCFALSLDIFSPPREIFMS